MKIINRVFLIFLITLPLVIGCSLPPKPFIPDSLNKSNYQDAIRYSRQYLEQYMKKSKTVGMAVAVIDSNRIVYSEGFGYADKGQKIRVTDSTTFMIASVSKLFTATAIMQLVETGVIVLDSPITTYLPEFKIRSRFNARPITVRDLLTHESGLPSDIYNGFPIGNRTYPGADTMYRTVPILCANEYVTNPPRTAWSYSNVGFSLLGCIIERVSKRSYSEYLQDNLFSKLDMNHSAVGFDDQRVKPYLSKGYINNEVEKPLYYRDIPAGDIVSCTKDLSHFVRMLFTDGTFDNQTILSKNTLEEMWKPQNSDVPFDFWRIGLAYLLLNSTLIPERIVQHAGDQAPFHAMLAALPDSKLGVVVTVNSEEGAEVPTKAQEKLLETFYEAKKGIKLKPKTPEPFKPVALSDARLHELAGYYQTTMGTVKAEIKGKDLVFPFSGKPVRLIAHSDSVFSLQYKLLGFIPIPSKDLQKLVLKSQIIQGHQIVSLWSNDAFPLIWGDRFVPESPPEEWLQRVGKYEIANERKPIFADSATAKRYKIDTLILSYDSTAKNLCLSDVSLKVLTSTEAVTRGIGRYSGETVRAYTENGKEYLWAWGFSLRKIATIEKQSR